MKTRFLAILATLFTIMVSTTELRSEKIDLNDLGNSMNQARTELSKTIKNALTDLDDTAFCLGTTKVAVIGKDTIVIADSVTDLSALHPTIKIDAPIYITPEQSEIASSSIVPDILRTIVKIIIILGVFALPIAIVYIICQYNLKVRQERNRLMEKAIDNDYQLPADYFTTKHIDFSNIRINEHNNGIQLVATGIGVGLFFIILGGYPIAALMLIPTLIGLLKMFSSRQPFNRPTPPPYSNQPSQSDNVPPTPPVPPTF